MVSLCVVVRAKSEIPRAYIKQACITDSYGDKLAVTLYVSAVFNFSQGSGANIFFLVYEKCRIRNMRRRRREVKSIFKDLAMVLVLVGEYF